MSNLAFCGSCGAPLSAPGSGCARCGTRPTTRRAPRPLVAAALGIVPGLGHVYLGEWRKGLALLGAFGVVQFLGLDLDLSFIGAAVGVPMEFGGAGLWMYSVWDAYRTARRLGRPSTFPA